MLDSVSKRSLREIFAHFAMMERQGNPGLSMEMHRLFRDVCIRAEVATRRHRQYGSLLKRLSELKERFLSEAQTKVNSGITFVFARSFVKSFGRYVYSFSLFYWARSLRGCLAKF